jgi:hypothetical protein
MRNSLILSGRSKYEGKLSLELNAKGRYRMTIGWIEYHVQNGEVVK